MGIYGYMYESRADGKVNVLCGKCCGRGRIEAYAVIDGGVCYSCSGHGLIKVISQAEHEKAEKRREQQRAYREKKRQEKIKAEEIEREKVFTAFENEYRDEIVALKAYEGNNPFIMEMLTRVNQKCPLSDKQIAAMVKIIEDEANKVIADVPEGRMEITGKVISVNLVPDMYSYHESYIAKITIDCGEYRLYGTKPKMETPMDGESLRGKTITFKATLSPKEKGFGYFKRPAKANLVE